MYTTIIFLGWLLYFAVHTKILGVAYNTSMTLTHTHQPNKSDVISYSILSEPSKVPSKFNALSVHNNKDPSA